MEKLKLGLDIHGVIDAEPEFFSALAYDYIAQGHEVHIITGITESDEVINELKSYGMQWTHFHSVSDHLQKSGIELLPHSTERHPFYPNNCWDPAKGIYCAVNNITVHYDDTPRYGEFFKTPFLLWNRKHKD